MVNSNNYQGSIIINSTNQITGSFNLAATNFSNYLALGHSNEQLLLENTQLLNQQNSSFSITDTNFYYKDSVYKYAGAKVVSNSVNKRNNYIVLNKGRKHGIRNDMGVFGINGIIGTIIGVSENFSTVMSILHKDTKISAKIKKNNQLVNLIWDGSNYQLGVLTDVPSHLDLIYGDTIITSGHSFIYPEGILIGTVENYYQNTGESFNRANVKFSTDFNTLFFVYIVDHLQKQELMELQNKSENE